MKPKVKLAWGLLALSIFISYLLSMTNPGIGNMEMGALLNLYLPGIAALFSIIILLILRYVFKNFFLRVYWPALLLLLLINVTTGIYLHFFYS